MNRLRRFLFNGIIMTVTSLVMNGIGVWFSVCISNRIGSQAMGIYQLIMSVYSFAVTLATSGISFAATRLISEELGKGCPGGVRRSVIRCIVYALVFSLCTGVGLFVTAPLIELKILSNADTVIPMQAMAVGLPFLAVSSVFGGYFTAVRRVAKNSAVQMIEQLIRIAVTMAALSLVKGKGLMLTCLAIAVSGVIAEIMSFISSFLLYSYDKRRYQSQNNASSGLTKKMLSIALPIAFSSYLRSGLLTVKNLLVPLGLQRSGLSHSSAVSFFGLMHGVVLPILLFPSAFIASFSGLIIPELAEYRARDNRVIGNKSIYYIIGRMLSLNLIFSVAVAAVLYTFAEPLGASMSRDPNTASYIKILAPIVPIMYVDNCIDCILKGLNEQLSSMKYNIIDASVSVMLVMFLLPVAGIGGYVIIICTSEILNFTLSLNRLIKVTKFKINVANTFIKPITAAVLSSVLCGFLTAFSSRGTFTLSVSVLLQLLAYIAVLFVLKCFSKDDMRWFKKILTPSGKSVESRRKICYNGVNK